MVTPRPPTSTRPTWTETITRSLRGNDRALQVFPPLFLIEFFDNIYPIIIVFFLDTEYPFFILGDVESLDAQAGNAEAAAPEPQQKRRRGNTIHSSHFSYFFLFNVIQIHYFTTYFSLSCLGADSSAHKAARGKAEVAVDEAEKQTEQKSKKSQKPVYKPPTVEIKKKAQPPNNKEGKSAKQQVGQQAATKK